MQTLQTERDAAAEEIDKQLQQINEVFSQSFYLINEIVRVGVDVKAVYI